LILGSCFSGGIKTSTARQTNPLFESMSTVGKDTPPPNPHTVPGHGPNARPPVASSSPRRATPGPLARVFLFMIFWFTGESSVAHSFARPGETKKEGPAPASPLGRGYMRAGNLLTEEHIEGWRRPRGGDSGA